MKNQLLCAVAAIAALGLAPAANAAVFTPADVSNFAVTFGADGSITANIGNRGLVGDFEDTFSFQLLTQGLGSGAVTTSFSLPGNSLVFTYADINGVEIPVGAFNGFTAVSASNIVLGAGGNFITIRGTAGVNGGSYGGNITFVPNAVPEPATWAMMLVGFGMVAGTMRYRRRSTKVVYA